MNRGQKIIIFSPMVITPQGNLTVKYLPIYLFKSNTTYLSYWSDSKTKPKLYFKWIRRCSSQHTV